MTEEYITVQHNGVDEFTVNRSRFIGYACPCGTEEEALSFLRKIKEKYRDATHHCYAYIIGMNSSIMRYSDDGEPGGTAGLPIIDVMRAQQIVNCCVVVVRYFGGTLLGTGGLVRAYTQGCKIALQAAKIVRMERTSRFLCDVPYACWDSVIHAAGNLPIHILNQEFAVSVTFTIAVRSKDADFILESFTRITSGRFEAVPADEAYEPWEI